MMHLHEVLNLMFWDSRTGAPQKGLAMRAEVIGTISAKKFAMSVSPEMKDYLEALTAEGSEAYLSPITREVVASVKKEFDRNAKIPQAEFKAYTIVKANAGKAWEAAKSASDFAMFQPHLEQLVSYNKRFSEYWSDQGHPYDALLDVHDPGMTVEQLDDVFAKLKARLIPLLSRVKQEKTVADTSFLFKRFPIAVQKELHHFLLQELGYDFQGGRLDETVHPFAIPINRNDVRITTRFVEDDFKSGLFGTIHECGHAFYELNIAEELIGTPLCCGASAGIHESQSLFWEKLIGRSQAFWHRYYPQLAAHNKEQFTGIEKTAFYRAIHAVQPSFIRIEADELTYPLHVILRYELEKALFADELKVADLPGAWREKMAEYLGITPPDDRAGILQDMHWSAGMFGHFPSYALGYLYAAQFRHAMIRELGPIDPLVENGDFAPIRAWLARNIHIHGKRKTPHELLLDVTGEPLNPDHLINYLEKKYQAIYQLDSFE
ncbi:carboxypeptidase M32 [Brevibacillus fluminis]|uniref:Metal-dependent carboxypeptidase n=2 Tax=Brevibacillus fluminis TaxID=511487 RepID=A0A3M8DAU1_9BACL|nr:carboxypeptidase M32 [Brevibacillus fluminis]